MKRRHYTYSACIDGYWAQNGKTMLSEKIDNRHAYSSHKHFRTLKKLNSWLRHWDSVLPESTDVEVYKNWEHLAWRFKIGGKHAGNKQ